MLNSQNIASNINQLLWIYCDSQAVLLFQLRKVDSLSKHKEIFINRSIVDNYHVHHQILCIFPKENTIIIPQFAKIRQLKTIYDGLRCTSSQKPAMLIHLILLQVIHLIVLQVQAEKLDRCLKNVWLPDHLSLQNQCLILFWERSPWLLCSIFCFYYWILE